MSLDTIEAPKAIADAGPKTAAEWAPYVGYDVRRVTKKGAPKTVRLLQAIKDVASVRAFKSAKPLWVPLRELQVIEPAKSRDMPKTVEGERYVLVDENAHRFFWSAKGRHAEPRWFETPSDAAAYADSGSAWNARSYHRKKRPLFFPSHVRILAMTEALALYGSWRGATAEHAEAAKLSREILDKALPKLNGHAPAPAPAPAAAAGAPVSADLFNAWERQRREVAAAEALAASARAKLVEMEAELDIALRRAALR